jgi:hypothetical protein
MEVYKRSKTSALLIAREQSIISNKNNRREINLVLISVQFLKQDPQ